MDPVCPEYFLNRKARDPPLFAGRLRSIAALLKFTLLSSREPLGQTHGMFPHSGCPNWAGSRRRWQSRPTFVEMRINATLIAP
jgi:hypothetical protein